MVPKEYQWIVALFSPLVRELNVWFSQMFFAKSSNGDIDSTEIYFGMDLGMSDANFLAVTVGSIATFVSSIVIISLDSLINLFTCLRIVSLKNKKESPKNTETLIKLLQQLIINEWIEVVVPIRNIMCLDLGFYGPNKE